jgi:hypothetical protein
MSFAFEKLLVYHRMLSGLINSLDRPHPHPERG